MSDLDDQIKNLSPARRALLRQRLTERKVDALPGLPRRQAGDPRVLSYAQQQMWFLDQLAPGPAYNVPYAVSLSGWPDTKALQKALDAIVGRHEILRTMYLAYQGKVIPAVAKNWEVEVRQVDLRGCEAAHDVEGILPLLQKDSARPFDLVRDLKLRTTLYRLKEDRAILLHVSHHIAWDLHSRTIFYRELEQFYSGFCRGEETVLPDLPVQYGDYGLWQRRQLQGEKLEQLEAYWKQQLSGAPPALELPADHLRPALQNLRGARFPFSLSAAILTTATVLSRDHKVTLYMTMLAVYFVFLHCYSGQEDLSIGSPFDERRHPDTEPLIGMFINTLVLRARLNRDSTFGQLLSYVRDIVLKAIAHQELPFEKIVDVVQPPRDLSRMPLFQANFRLQGVKAPQLQLAGMEVESCRLIDNATAKFDLALELPSLPESNGYLEYSTNLFRAATVHRMADDFQSLLSGLLAQPDVPLHRVESVRMLRARIGRVTSW